MKKLSSGLVAVVFLAAFSLGGVMSHGGSVGFGFGGPAIGIVTLDLNEINVILEDAWFAPLSERVITYGGGGGGGTIGEFSFGGLGWGGSVSSLTENREAELSIGFGGMDVSYVLAGSERSLLSLGIVLGGGEIQLEVHDLWAEDLAEAVMFKTTATLTRPFFAVEPYVAFHLQPLGWLGFRIQLGYLYSFPERWKESGHSVTGPDLDLTGPHISVSIAFGGIGSADLEECIESALKADEATGLAIAKETITALKAGDPDPLEGWLAEDIIWSTPAGTWTGKQAVLEAMSTLEGTDLEIDDVMIGDDNKVVIIWHYTSEESGEAIRGMTVCRVVNGKVVSATDYQG
jgi:hypothetical protein